MSAPMFPDDPPIDDRDWLGGMTVHPLVDVAPMLPDDELADLAADIKQNGLLHPIVRTVDGKTLVDGRNRLKACILADVDPIFDDRIRNEAEARALIMSANLQRRNLSISQRAIWAAMLDPEPKQGKRTDLLGGPTSDVSRERLSRARTVLRYSRELADEVLADEVSLDAAYATATEAERAKRKKSDALKRLREVANDLADRVERKELSLDEAWTLHKERDEADRETRRGAFNAWREIGRTTRWIAQTPSVLDLPEWLTVEEYDSEFRQYFRGGVPELIQSLEHIDAARAVAIKLINTLNDRRKK